MADQKQKGNQSENEFFAVVATGRKGLESVFEKMGQEIRDIAAPNVNRGFETWAKRALVDLANRDELAPILATRAGLFSVYKALAKAATMGLQLGGAFPQAYFMPAEGKVELVPTAEGYAFVSAHGPGAVLRSAPELMRVYEHDGFRIDQKQGIVEHTYDPRADRGRLCGWYMRLEYQDGHVEIPYVGRDKVNQIIENYSRLKTKAGAVMPAFAKSRDEMEDKTAAKKLLRRPARLAEGLAMLYSLEGDDDSEERPVGERMAERLTTAAEGLGPGTQGPKPDDARSVPEQQEPPASQEQAGQQSGQAGAQKDPQKGDLF